jgi:hypothetical protein
MDVHDQAILSYVDSYAIGGKKDREINVDPISRDTGTGLYPVNCQKRSTAEMSLVRCTSALHK